MRVPAKRFERPGSLPFLLRAQFLAVLPVSNVMHPDGVLNCLAHAPINAFQPDYNIKLTASWDTNAATATTRLHSEFCVLLTRLARTLTLFGHSVERRRGTLHVLGRRRPRVGQDAANPLRRVQA